jgi:dTDP-4-amino-4,6-dideoxygalactose transaminase
VDPAKIADAIGPRTKAICVVHYAGVACEMDAIMSIAKQHNLIVIEDAAHSAFGTYRGRALGTFGAVGALSFHETKNLISGEGGALLVNDAKLVPRAEILREKGTNRSAFFRGDVDKYTWVDLGSSYLPSEMTAAFLWAQLERADDIQERRRAIWSMYYDALASLEDAGLLRRPILLEDRPHSAHMFYVMTKSLDARTRALAHLRELGVGAVFHYVPLHSSPGGQRYGRTASDMAVTDRTSDTLLRLPFWVGMDESTIGRVANALREALSGST